MVKKKERKNKFTPLFFYVSFLAAIFLLLICVYFLGLIFLDQKIFPGVKVAGLDLGWQSREQALNNINKVLDDFRQGSEVTFKNKTILIKPEIPGESSDSLMILAEYDLESTIDQAFVFGRQGNLLENFWQQINALFYGYEVPVKHIVNDVVLEKILKEEFNGFLSPAVNASLERDSRGNFYIQPEKDGKTLDFDLAINEFRRQAALMKRSPIILQSKIDRASLRSNFFENLNIQQLVEERLPATSHQLYYLNNSWPISKKQLINWLDLGLVNNRYQVIFEKNRVANYLEKNIAPKINQDAKNARFEFKDGRLLVIEFGSEGLALSINTSSQLIIENLTKGATSTELIVEKIPAKIIGDEANNLNIVEVVGSGKSNFSGSPKNRRHNIAIGAASLNGILIKPDEEFSLLKALGKIDASAGYLPELVIKKNKTTPEYGGGLCQIGTTLFRAVLNVGLPITQRRNHSYRVSYYEPAGTDATIYDPAPDFRFINDTGNYLLLQTAILGDDLVFTFWGKSDGRKVEQTKPVIYNIVKPPPTKIIPTTELKPGEKKCTEKPHSGADAYFDYKVTYASGEVKERRFNSHYVPWQEVCLVGATSTEFEKNNTINTSTLLIATSTSN